MSNDPTTDLAPAPAALPMPPKKPEKSLIADLAAQAGIDPGNFLAAVKVAAGCKGATNEHFMVLLMQAQRYDLDPLSSPPQLQLLDVGQGPQVYARLDAYKVFLQRAEAAGRIEWRKYEEGWFPDPAQPPEKQATARGGRVTMKLRNVPDPIVKTVWFREWGGKGQWVNRGSHMLEARAWKEVCRDYLGFVLYDEDDARQIEEGGIRRTEAEVRDAAPIAPAVPIPALGGSVPAATFAPAPAPLGETMPFEQDTMAHEEPPVAAQAEPWTPTPEEEAKIRAEEKRQQAGLFGNG